MRRVTDLGSDLREAIAVRIWNELPRYELMYPECERIASLVMDTTVKELTRNAVRWEAVVDDFGAASQRKGLVALLLLDALRVAQVEGTQGGEKT